MLKAGSVISADRNANGPDGVVLRFQGDGNLVLYLRGIPIWASNKFHPRPVEFAMQGDGNAVCYGRDEHGGMQPYWATDTFSPGASFRFNLDGVAVVPAVAAHIWSQKANLPEIVPVKHPDPLDGQVRLVNGSFGDNRGPRAIGSFHAGDWLGQGMVYGPSHIISEVDVLADAGVHVARSWFQLKTIPGRSPFWDSKPAPRWNPADDPQRFAECCNVFTSRGIKLHVAGGGIKDMSDGEETAAFSVLRDTIDQIGPEHFALVEACNEIRDTGDEDDIEPSELTRLVNIVRSRFPNILYALSAYTGTEDRPTLRRYTPDWMGFYLQHDYRGGRAHDKIRHLFSGAYEGVVVRRNCWHGEPFGVLGQSRLVSAQDNGHELDAHVMALSAAMSAMTRGAWTYMSGPGVIHSVEPVTDLPGFRETWRILRDLPQDVGSFNVLGHSGPNKRGQRIHAVRDDAPDVRADYAIEHDGGRYVEIIYGPPEQRKDLPQERATRDDVVLEEGPWGRVTSGRLA